MAVTSTPDGLTVRPAGLLTPAAAIAREAARLAASCRDLSGAPGALARFGGSALGVAADVAAVTQALCASARGLAAYSAALGGGAEAYATVDAILAQRMVWTLSPDRVRPLALAQLAATLTGEALVAALPPQAEVLGDLAADAVPDAPGHAEVAGIRSGAPAPTTPAQLLAGVTDAQRTDRTIAVTAVAGGRYIVSLPGIQSLLPTPSPLDLPDAVRAEATGHGDYGRAVALALTLAGVPAGSPLLLVGHSEGGIVAADLAADPGFTDRWPVPVVLTAGAPISRVKVPAATSLLSLVNRNDVVPALDLSDPAARHDRVTVQFRDERGSVGGNHSLAGVYTPFAASLHLATAPGVAAWERAAAPFLGGGTAAVTYVEVADRAPATPGPRRG